MPSYASSERDLATALRDLHAYVWTGARRDEAELLARLLRGARSLDRHIGMRGGVERAVRPIARTFRRFPQGADLFTYLQAVAGLSYAADRVHRRPGEAATAASELVVSLSLRLASVSSADDLAEEFESGRRGFAGFIARLGKRLEVRGVLRAAEFARVADLTFDIRALWNRKSPLAARRIMAEASVAAAGFACMVFVEALRALGRYREIPYGRLIPAVAAILGGLGGQP